jgi:hypothetical protein
MQPWEVSINDAVKILTNVKALCEGWRFENVLLHFSTSGDYRLEVKISTSAPLLQSALGEISEYKSSYIFPNIPV